MRVCHAPFRYIRAFFATAFRQSIVKFAIAVQVWMCVTIITTLTLCLMDVNLSLDFCKPSESTLMPNSGYLGVNSPIFCLVGFMKRRRFVLYRIIKHRPNIGRCCFSITGARGLEPRTYGFGDRRSTNWAIPLRWSWQLVFVRIYFPLIAL